MGAIRKSAVVQTDSVTTHIVRIDLSARDLPDMSNADICEVYLQITPTQDNRKPITKKFRLTYSDMDTLTSEFVVRNF